MKQICKNCIHFGKLKGPGGLFLGHICMAPITTEPPKDGETKTKNPFVYSAYEQGTCELWTADKKAVPAVA